MCWLLVVSLHYILVDSLHFKIDIQYLHGAIFTLTQTLLNTGAAKITQTHFKNVKYMFLNVY